MTECRANVPSMGLYSLCTREAGHDGEHRCSAADPLHVSPYIQRAAEKAREEKILEESEAALLAFMATDVIQRALSSFDDREMAETLCSICWHAGAAFRSGEILKECRKNAAQTGMEIQKLFGMEVK